MSQISITSQVNNVPYAKQLGLPRFYYRKRGYTNLNGSSPAEQYQRLKQIQNTVRVYASLYPANLGPLTAYKKPLSDPNAGFYGVCWNQMSDRPVASVQRATVPTGFQTAMNRRRTSVTSSKPGCQTPGGTGCDIKHNSYDRYLNRLKGKGPLRRGVVPPTFGLPIPFNRAAPVYGDKTVKTNIVASCGCPIDIPSETLRQNLQLYNNPLWQSYPSATFSYTVGDFVYAIQPGQQFYVRAQITNIGQAPNYTVTFADGSNSIINIINLLPYVPCNCNATQNNTLYPSGLFTINGAQYNQSCILPRNVI